MTQQNSSWKFIVRATSDDHCIYMGIFFESLPHKVGSGAPQQFSEGSLWRYWSALSSQLCDVPLNCFQWHSFSHTVSGNSAKITDGILFALNISPFPISWWKKPCHVQAHFHPACAVQGHGRLVPIPHLILNKTPRSHQPLWVMLSLITMTTTIRLHLPRVWTVNNLRISDTLDTVVDKRNTC